VSKSGRTLAPFLAAGLLGLYLLRKRIRFPEFIRSGMALVIVTGIVLMLSLVGLLAGLFNAAQLLRGLVPR